MSDHRDEVKSIFHTAIELPLADRAAFVSSATAHPAIRQEVESLLAAHEQARDFIETPGGLEAAATVVSGAPAAPVRVGPYQLAHEIGRGGMGSVYLATRDDGEYRQRVAVKLLARDAAREFVHRFQQERQILAALDHRNIARLLDGGTTEDGVPYFVMEYVDGVPIDAYCDARRLGVDDRLRLFCTVCAAVQYAHQNLVVHRDLKPGNILVATDGTPKLLDFGIAKLLAPDGGQPTGPATATASRMLTPEYASPEQVRGDPVATTSDVYSLGVLLYRMLAGRSPYRLNSEAPHELARAICEQEPERPSAAAGHSDATVAVGTSTNATGEAVAGARATHPDKLRRRFAGDLDTIVLKAIRKDPGRRYASVEQLSADIHRHLTALPVLARPDTLRYRAAKFVARHTVGVAAAALVAVTLVGGIVATTWQARRAEAERARAQQRFNDLRSVANTFLFELHDAVEPLAGSTPVRQMLVRRALEYLDVLTREGSGDPVLERELATAYERIGDVQDNPSKASLGDFRASLASHRTALAMREAVARRDRDDPAVMRELAASYVSVGNLLEATGDSRGALETLRRALAVFESVPPSRRDLQLQRDIVRAHTKLGSLLLASGDSAGALEQHRQALANAALLARTHPADREVQREWFYAQIYLGDAREAVGDLAGSLEEFRAAQAIARTLGASHPSDAPVRRFLAVSYQRLGDAYFSLGDLEKALEANRSMLTLNETAAAADPKNALARRDFAIGYDKVGKVLMKRGDLDGALAHQLESLSIRRQLAAADPSSAVARTDLSISHTKIGDIHATGNRFRQALESYRRAREIDRQSVKADPGNVRQRSNLAHSHTNVGDMLWKLGELSAALESYRAAAAIRDALHAGDRTNALRQATLAEVRLKLGHAAAAAASAALTPRAVRIERWQEARAAYQSSVDTWRDLRARASLTADQQKRLDEAVRAVLQCDKALRRAGIVKTAAPAVPLEPRPAR